jgi:hypothetical protein
MSLQSGYNSYQPTSLGIPLVYSSSSSVAFTAAQTLVAPSLSSGMYAINGSVTLTASADCSLNYVSMDLSGCNATASYNLQYIAGLGPTNTANTISLGNTKVLKIKVCEVFKVSDGYGSAFSVIITPLIASGTVNRTGYQFEITKICN